jgi:hypothetical protein
MSTNNAGRLADKAGRQAHCKCQYFCGSHYLN